MSNNQPNSTQDNNLECPICFRVYLPEKNPPKSLPNCEHTICTSCLDKALLQQPSVCPIDKAVISNDLATSVTFPTNFFIFEVIGEHKKLEARVCQTHGRFKKFVCMDDKKPICKQCLDEPEHKGHNTLRVEEVNVNAEPKKTQLEAKLKEFPKQQYIQAYDKLNELKMGLETMILEKFAEAKKMLDDKKAKVILGLQDYFTEERQKIDDRYQKDIENRERLKKKIKILDSQTFEQDFYKVIIDKDNFQFSENPHNFYRPENAETIINNFNKAFLDITQKATIFAEHYEVLPRLTTESVIITSEHKTPDYFLKFIQKEENCLKITSKNYTIKSGSEIKLSEVDWSKTKKIQLELSDIKITKDFLDSFAMLWRDHFSINDLKLNLATNNISDRDFYLLWFPMFSNLLAPEALEINLRNSKVTNLGVCQLLSQLSEFSVYGCNLSRVRRFSLWLSNTTVTDKPIQELASKVLPLLTSLEDFQLYLGGTPITDVSFGSLASSLQKVPTHKIHTFALFLSDIQVKDKNLTSLAISLSEMINLKDLRLGLHGSKITDTGIEQLFIGIKGVISNLEGFSLYIGNTKVSDSSIKTYSQVISNMTKLNNLVLDLSGSQVSDTSMVSFFAGMNPIAWNIKSFAVYLGGCKITDKTIESLAKNAIPQMSRLESFHFNLSNTGVKDSSILELFNSSNQILGGVKSILLSFTKTKISDSAVQAFNKQLSSISGDFLKDLTLYFEETSVTDKSVLELCQIVSKFHISKKPLQVFKVKLSSTKVKEETVQMVNEIQDQLEKSQKI